jgi:hypothetical protein
MKIFKLILIFSILSLQLFAQKNEPLSIFFESKTTELRSTQHFYATPLILNKLSIRKILNEKLDSLSISLPTPDGTKILNLEKISIYVDEPKIYSECNDVFQPQSLIYSAKIEGNDSAFASVVINEDSFQSYIMGDGEGWIFGPVEKGYHGVWHELDVKDTTQFKCFIPNERDFSIKTNKNQTISENSNKIKYITMYFEADYDMVEKLGSSKEVIKFVENIFAQTFLIYQKEGVNIKINRFKIWDRPSGYNFEGVNVLYHFGNQFVNQDLPETFAQLVSLRSGFGVAWLSTLCDIPRYRTSYSGLDMGISNFPNYSWNVTVMTHEIGHSLGSPHTHSCSWNGNNTAIDGCWFVEQTEAVKCPELEVTPETKGTIMSYCHLNPKVGINYQWGFGPQPGNLIRKNIQESICVPFVDAPIDCSKADSSYVKLKIEIDQNKFLENFYYSIEQNGLLIINYTKAKRLSLDTTICIKKDSCFTLKLKHSASAPFKNKINFRILNGFDTLFQVNNVYVINDTIKICPKVDTKKDISRIINNNYWINNYDSELLSSDRWVLYNFLGQKVLEGVGKFNFNVEENNIETGLYVLTKNNVFYKKYFVKKIK